MSPPKVKTLLLLTTSYLIDHFSNFLSSEPFHNSRETMSTTRYSNCFKPNFIIWKIFGLWPGRTPSKYYKYFSLCYLFLTFFIYNVILTLNLFYTPGKMLIRELFFYFTEVIVASKIITILLMRNKILHLMDLLDSASLESDDDISNQIMNKSLHRYKLFCIIYAIFINVTFCCKTILPIFVHFMFGSNLDLPISKYYFLSDEFRNNYFVLLYLYQTIGMYGHTTYNVNTDAFVDGLIYLVTAQVKIVNYKMRNLKLTSSEKKQVKRRSIQEEILITKLHQCLRRYETILRYCSVLQEVFNANIFVLFSMISVIICIVVCAVVLLPSVNKEFVVFVVAYLCALLSHIFLPGYLGTQLSHESQELVFAAYNSDWIPRSRRFKSSISLFVTRANTPIVLTAYNLFPLSLSSCTSVLKMAYSLYAVVGKFQAVQK